MIYFEAKYGQMVRIRQVLGLPNIYQNPDSGDDVNYIIYLVIFDQKTQTDTQNTASSIDYQPIWYGPEVHPKSEEDWDQKASATIHTKKIKRPLFYHFVWEFIKAPATNVAALLWPVRPCPKYLFFKYIETS
jgi:hypothetical protein